MGRSRRERRARDWIPLRLGGTAAPYLIMPSWCSAFPGGGVALLIWVIAIRRVMFYHDRHNIVFLFGIVLYGSCTKRAESPTFTSVGQRPTYGVKKNSKPCKGAIKGCRPYRACSYLTRNVGRCPTLVNVRASPCKSQAGNTFAARRDGLALPYYAELVLGAPRRLGPAFVVFREGG